MAQHSTCAVGGFLLQCGSLNPGPHVSSATKTLPHWATHPARGLPSSVACPAQILPSTGTVPSLTARNPRFPVTLLQNKSHLSLAVVIHFLREESSKGTFGALGYEMVSKGPWQDLRWAVPTHPCVSSRAIKAFMLVRFLDYGFLKRPENNSLKLCAFISFHSLFKNVAFPLNISLK
jgi:hypothetical protein